MAALSGIDTVRPPRGGDVCDRLHGGAGRRGPGRLAPPGRRRASVAPEPVRPGPAPVGTDTLGP
ncbi:MAG: hypothetical protein AVDCRST_MAG24-429 [uncultured Nocardioidaceae bacterium]|uniref:Uncharacterized protein n=1 Tax=uncultured Nocardioidaceae bacterium TaxID=253824 RepID=A0A6J4L5S3_9ACTN|nr:MAG: hypothetical protein AVDCRST_MAG24-429 [uncultured Nocardioidaceae bacterium]